MTDIYFKEEIAPLVAEAVALEIKAAQLEEKTQKVFSDYPGFTEQEKIAMTMEMYNELMTSLTHPVEEPVLDGHNGQLIGVQDTAIQDQENG